MSCDRDLTLDEALSDPVIGAALRADRVDPRRFEALLRTAARKLDDGRSAMPRATALLAGRCRRPSGATARGRQAAAGDLCAW